MARYGNTVAAAVATQLVNDFPRVKFCFLVGIGGGVPSGTSDIRLGDVVVSTPEGDHGGVVQYDLGRRLSGDRFEKVGILNVPPRILTTHSSMLRAQREKHLGEQMHNHLKAMMKIAEIWKENFHLQG